MTNQLFCLLIVALAAGSGVLIPFIADKTMRRKHAAYQSWFATGAQGYASFFNREHRVPDPKARGDEGAWGIWAQHLPSLVFDRAVSREEVESLLSTKHPSIAHEYDVTALPLRADLVRQFSLEHKTIIAGGCASCMALCAGVVTAHAVPLAATLALLALVALCLLISLVDARCRIIPLEFTGALALCGLAWQATQRWPSAFESLVAAGIIFGVLVAIEAGATRVWGKHSIGGGDLRTLPVAVLITGFPGIIIGAAFMGIIFFTLALPAIITGRITLTTKIPFGPFIAFMVVTGSLSSVL
ncbi:MAG: prepilin peptidase [Raoultibacter sp.]